MPEGKNYIVRSQAEAHRLKEELRKVQKQEKLAEAEAIVLWAENSTTKKVIDKLDKEVTKFEKKILEGKCEDFSEYKGFTKAREFKLKLGELIKDSKKDINQLKGES